MILETNTAAIIKRVHHINFVVRDLDRAAAKYAALLGCDPVCEELPQRGVRLARFAVGEVWVVLVQPLADGAPARHLATQGEGFFLISYAVDDLSADGPALSDATGWTLGPTRTGVDNWQVADFDAAETFGAIVGLVQPD